MLLVQSSCLWLAAQCGAGARLGLSVSPANINMLSVTYIHNAGLHEWMLSSSRLAGSGMFLIKLHTSMAAAQPSAATRLPCCLLVSGIAAVVLALVAHHVMCMWVLQGVGLRVQQYQIQPLQQGFTVLTAASCSAGGELQRFAIAVVAAQAADIYMIDEPSSYLDVRQRLKAAQVKNQPPKPAEVTSYGLFVVRCTDLHEQQGPSNISPTLSCCSGIACSQSILFVQCPLRKLLGYLPCSGRFHSKARVLCT